MFASRAHKCAHNAHNTCTHTHTISNVLKEMAQTEHINNYLWHSKIPYKASTREDMLYWVTKYKQELFLSLHFSMLVLWYLRTIIYGFIVVSYINTESFSHCTRLSMLQSLTTMNQAPS